jgi:hypothetical protein
LFSLLLSLIAASNAWADDAPQGAEQEIPSAQEETPLESADNAELELAANSRRWTLGVEAVAEVPLHIGATLQAQAPNRLRLSLSMGYLPGAYVDLINSVATTAGWYNDATAALITVALSQSLITRMHVGWQPWASRGFYFDGGYTLATLGGGASTEEFIIEATGQEPSGDSDALTNEYRIRSTLHMVDLEFGWRWLIRERFTVRTALGYSGTMSASTSVEGQFESSRPQISEAFEQGVADYLDSIYGSYVHTAVITLALGYRVR